MTGWGFVFVGFCVLSVFKVAYDQGWEHGARQAVRDMCAEVEELGQLVCGLQEVEQRARWAEETSRAALAEVERLRAIISPLFDAESSARDGHKEAPPKRGD